ncbi:hypothetical protein FA15DRAFT_655958 [Coprinopsis marcescibilis]|uniref:Uncharacterized protein n=1 Tax=Coprinopsis marcescibilis TaxID=230819 RepID=A0A5C3KV61_COPMA|nr:hypothetical protein FA15DRAFT_655958 [Coprinopsis marcescibilis]
MSTFATAQSSGPGVSISDNSDTVSDINTLSTLVEAIAIGNEPVPNLRTTMLTIRRDELAEVGVVVPTGKHHLSQFPVIDGKALRRFMAIFHEKSVRISTTDTNLEAQGLKTLDVELKLHCEEKTEATRRTKAYWVFVDNICNMTEAGTRSFIDFFVLGMIGFCKDIGIRHIIYLPEATVASTVIEGPHSSLSFTGRVDYALISLKVSKWKELKDLGTLFVDTGLSTRNSYISIIEEKTVLEKATPADLNAYFAQVAAQCVGSHGIFGGEGVTWSISNGITWIFGVYLGGRMESTVIGDNGDGMSLADIFKIVMYWTLVEPRVILNTGKEIFGLSHDP